MPYLELRGDDEDGEPSKDDTGKNVGIVIACIVAVAILVPVTVLLRDCLLKIHNRGRVCPRGQGPAPVNHLNPADLMRLSSWRARQRDGAEGKEELDLHDDDLKTIAPELLYRNLSFASIKEMQHTTAAIKVPPAIVVRPPSPKDTSAGIDPDAFAARPKDRAQPLASGFSCRDPAGVPDTKALCSICLEEYAPEDLVRQTRCGHVFHSGCLALWLDGYGARCPLCQAWLRQPREDV